LIVIAISALAFIESLRFEFVFDDIGQIVENPSIHSIRSLPEYFTRPVAQNFYRPLFMVWLLVNHTLFGVNPFWWHLMSILLHVTAGVLVYRLARRLLASATGAMIAALLFAVHPTKIEAVAWVSGVTEPMAGIFVLGSLLAFLRSGEHGGRIWMAVAALSALAAILSKETGIVVLPLVLLYAYLFEEPGRAGKAMRSTVPFVLAAAVYLIARVFVVGGLARPVGALTTAETLATLPSVVAFYLMHLVWPLNLAVYYDLPPATSIATRSFFFPLIAIFACVSVVIWVWQKTHDRVWLFGWAWVFITLTPVLYLRAFSVNDFVHDRYLYLPSVGLAIVVASLIERWRERSITAVPVAVLLGGMLLFATVAQIPYWKNNFLLFRRAYEISPRSEYALNNLGIEMEKRGDYDRAVSLYQAAIDKNPQLWTAQYNLGLFLYRTGSLAKADEHLAAALAVNPDYTPALANRALVRMHLRDFNTALELAQRAVDIVPNSASYLTNLGTVRIAAGDAKGAREAFVAALRNDPRNAEAQEALRAMPQK
jgi:Tfp pilus assembly protein PilF